MASSEDGGKAPEQGPASPEKAQIDPKDNEDAAPATTHEDEPQSDTRSPSAAPDGSNRESSSEGEVDSDDDAPPLPSEAPPLPHEPAPEPVDDGWSCEWDATRGSWYFFNRFTGMSQWDNPRVPTAPDVAAVAPGTATAAVTSNPASAAGGYNPAIHGDWDPNAPYAQAYTRADETVLDAPAEPLPDATVLQVPGAFFNKRTGQFQLPEQTSERHTDEAKSHRQMDAYFDVDRAANSHDGRSLKAERQGKKPTKKELAAWKEKRKARKEEKRRAWLRD